MHQGEVFRLARLRLWVVGSLDSVSVGSRSSLSQHAATVARLVTAIAFQAEALVGRLGPTPMSRCRQGAYGKLTRAQMFYFDTPAVAEFLGGRAGRAA